MAVPPAHARCVVRGERGRSRAEHNPFGARRPVRKSRRLLYEVRPGETRAGARTAVHQWHRPRIAARVMPSWS